MIRWIPFRTRRGELSGISDPSSLFHCKVTGIRSLVSYEVTTAKTLVKNFHEAVDDYLALCRENGKTPEKACKGSF